MNNLLNTAVGRFCRSLIQKIAELIEERFLTTVIILSTLYLIPQSILSFSQGGGTSVLRDMGISGVLLYIFLWGIASLPVLYIARKSQDRDIPASLHLISLVLMFIVLTGVQIIFLSKSPLEGDAESNYVFLQDYSSHSDMSMMQFYNASTRPRYISMNDSVLISTVSRMKMTEWVADNWRQDIPGNVRCSLTPPVFFYLITGFQFLFGNVTAWVSLFTFVFGSGCIILLWLLISRHFSFSSATYAAFTFAQGGSVLLYFTKFLSDAPAMFLFLLGLYTLDGIDAGKRRVNLKAFISGIFFCLAFLTRMTFIPVVGLICLLILMHQSGRLLIISMISTGMLITLLIFIALGFNPLILRVTIPIITDQYFERVGLSGMKLMQRKVMCIGQWIAGIGFGWLLLAFNSALKTVDRFRNIRFWQSPWILLAVPVWILLIGGTTMNRYFVSGYPLLMGLALCSRMIKESNNMIRIAAISVSVLTAFQIVF